MTMTDLWSLEQRRERAILRSNNLLVTEGTAVMQRMALLAEGFTPWSWASLPGVSVHESAATHTRPDGTEMYARWDDRADGDRTIYADRPWLHCERKPGQR